MWRGVPGSQLMGSFPASPLSTTSMSKRQRTQRDSVAQAILDIRQHHRGQAQAITVGALQQHLLVSSRRIRRAIQELVVTQRVPIASSVQAPYGFYLITTEEEARRCLHQYWSRVREVSRRAQILNDTVKERFGIDVKQEFRFDDEDRAAAA